MDWCNLYLPGYPPVHGLHGAVLPVEDLLAGHAGGVPLGEQGHGDVHPQPSQTQTAFKTNKNTQEFNS